MYSADFRVQNFNNIESSLGLVPKAAGWLSPINLIIFKPENYVLGHRNSFIDDMPLKNTLLCQLSTRNCSWFI